MREKENGDKVELGNESWSESDLHLDNLKAAPVGWKCRRKQVSLPSLHLRTAQSTMRNDNRFQPLRLLGVACMREALVLWCLSLLLYHSLSLVLFQKHVYTWWEGRILGHFLCHNQLFQKTWVACLNVQSLVNAWTGTELWDERSQKRSIEHVKRELCTGEPACVNLWVRLTKSIRGLLEKSKDLAEFQHSVQRTSICPISIGSPLATVIFSHPFLILHICP